MATATRVQTGNVIEYVSVSALSRGQIVRIGHLIGVATEGLTATDIAQGRSASIDLEGVYTVPKKTGTAWTAGAALYWSDSEENFHTVSTSRYFAGFAPVAAGSSDTTGKCRLAAMDT